MSIACHAITDQRATTTAMHHRAKGISRNTMRSRWRAVCALTIGVSVTIAVRALPAQRTPSVSDTAVAAAMHNYTRVLKLVNADSSAALFTADAEMLQAGMAPIRGREAIRAFLKPFDGRAIVDSASSTIDTIESHGTTAYLWGSYHQRTRIPPGAFADYDGRVVIEWRRDADHAWRIARILMQPAG